MEKLNDDMIAYILNFTNTKTICRCLIINKKWNEIIKNYCWMFQLNFSLYYNLESFSIMLNNIFKNF